MEPEATIGFKVLGFGLRGLRFIVLLMKTLRRYPPNFRKSRRIRRLLWPGPSGFRVQGTRIILVS